MNNDINNTYSEQVAHSQNYRRMIYAGSLIGAIFLIIFALIDTFILQLLLDGIVEAIGAIILLLIAYMEKKAPVKPWVIVTGLLIIALIIGIAVFANNSSDGVIIWVSLLPFLSFFLLGEKQGLKISLFISLIYISALIFTSIIFPEKGFNPTGIVTATGALFCSILLAMTYEKNRTHMINLLGQQAKTDPLTSLLNRRGFMASFNLFMSLPKKRKQGLCVLIMDLDKFKSINDNFGHDIGDIVIIQCATTMKLMLRNIDSVARLGGEEFIALLPNTSLSEAEVIAQKVRTSIENLEIKTVNNINIKVTASIGITNISKNRTSFSDLYKTADEALYEAKNNGRNGIVLKE